MSYLDAIDRQISEVQCHLDALKEKREKMKTVKQLLEELNISEALKKVGLQYVSHDILTSDVSKRFIEISVDVRVKTYKKPNRVTSIHRSKLYRKATEIAEKWDALNTEFSLEINSLIFEGSGSIELQYVYLIYEY